MRKNLTLRSLFRFTPRKHASANRRRLRLEFLESRLCLFSNGVLPFGILGPPRHEEISELALSFLDEDVLDEIIDENVAVDVADVLELQLGGPGHPENHFDGNAFSFGAAAINAKYEAFLDLFASEDAFDDDDLAEIFGTILHPIQDFYSHTNWVEYVQAGVIGSGALVDEGLEFWAPLTPYSEIQPGVLLVQGEDTTPDVPGFGEATLSRVGADVTISFPGGVTRKGLISGDFEGETNYSPDNIAIGHDDPNGLNKDRPDRPLHFQASAYALLQTQHEFKRLVNLVRGEYGEEGVCRLIENWAQPDPESQIALREVLDLPTAEGRFLDLVFVIDTTGSMSDDIAAVQEAALEIVEHVQSVRPFTHIGIVLYKDFGDEYVATTWNPFTCDAEELVEAIQSISVGGGGDTPEAVYSGLIHAIESLEDLGEWRQEGEVDKIIILMGDAPPHDPEPTSQPEDTGYTLDDVLERAATGGIDVIPSPEVTLLSLIEPQSPAPEEEPSNQFDVSGDGGVSPIDALLIINKLIAAGGSVETADGVDVNADGWVSPLDVLLVINVLNSDAAGPLVAAAALPGPDGETQVLGAVSDLSGVRQLSMRSPSGEWQPVPFDLAGQFSIGADQGTALLKAVDFLGNETITELILDSSPAGDEESSVVAPPATATALAGEVSPIRIFTIVIGFSSSAIAAFEAIAAGTGGQAFQAETADDVVETILEAIGEAVEGNDPPVIESYATSADQVGSASPGDPVTITGSFTDPDAEDTHTVLIDWGDGSVTPATVVEADGQGTFTATHVYVQGGIHVTTATIADGSEATDEATAAAFITGMGFRDDVLSFIGTESSDSLVVERLPSGELLVVASFLQGLPAVQLNIPADSLLLALLGDGHDVVVIGSRVANPTAIFTGHGHDFVQGGSGPDEIHGGPGNDRLLGQNGADQIFGEEGLDSLFGGNAGDLLDGGPDTDLVSGDAGDDDLLGDAPPDLLLGGPGNDTINGNLDGGFPF